MKVLLKKEICGSRKQCIGPTDRRWMLDALSKHMLRVYLDITYC